MSNGTVTATTFTIMFIKFVDHRTHPIIPKLNDAAVKTCQNPWSFWMK